MGPRHCCRGIRRPLVGTIEVIEGFNGAAALLPRNRGVKMETIIDLTSFNGAAALLPRNHGSGRAKSRIHIMLQWGRGIAAAESHGN